MERQEMGAGASAVLRQNPPLSPDDAGWSLIGVTVELRGLERASNLNGMRGVVEDNLQNGRVRVRLRNQRVDLKPSNTAPIGRARLIADLTKRAVITPIELTNLKNQPELNGQRGVLHQKDSSGAPQTAADGRVEVEIPGTPGAPRHIKVAVNKIILLSELAFRKHKIAVDDAAALEELQRDSCGEGVLISLCKEGSLAFLKGSYIVDLHKRGGRIERCHDAT